MSIPISIETLLERNTIEWARIEFKENWNPEPILKTISAFANDIDNWGGGYIVVGIAEENGMIKRPVTGLAANAIDKIQKELLQYCKYLKPAYLPVSEPVTYDGKNLLLIWVPGGYERPYECPKYPLKKDSQKVYYIRKFSSTIEATESDVKELQSLSQNIPFDDRINPKGNLSDLKFPLIQDYLSVVNSNLYERASNMNISLLAKDLRIAEGPQEYFKPINAGLLFFNDNPEKFFPYTRIEIVNIPDPTGQGMEEKSFTGPIHRQLQDALSYIRNHIITEKVFKVDNKAEAERYYNYSYAAIEEFLSNAVYHKSYQIHEPITVRIEKDTIEITSIPGPDRSISDEDIQTYRMRSRRYRNRRIGDFLKELHLVEGRNTGIPKAINAIESNGSPLPQLLTDSERSYFSVILKIHPSFITGEPTKNLQKKKSGISKRMNRAEIRNCILMELQSGEKSLNEIYKRQGYTSSVSNAFREVLKELIAEGKVIYLHPGSTSPNNILKLIK
ncbi:RNA-binding domain-containing protein [Anaerovoracaceae bacterium 42-11]